MVEGVHKTLAEIEKEAIEESLFRHDFNVSAVIKELDITRYYLYSKLAKYGIKKPKDDLILN